MTNEGQIVPAESPPESNKKMMMQSSRSWIVVNSTGDSTVMDADKHAIMHRVDINARDLRILDPLLSYPSAILGREKAIVLNLEHIKAIITAEEVLLRNPSKENVIPVVQELQRQFPSANADKCQRDGEEYTDPHNDDEPDQVDESPFEFRALEVVLEAICSFLAARTMELEAAAHPALDELISKVSSRSVDSVRKLKGVMTGLIARVHKVRDELEQLMDDDDDMADLYLSRKLAVASSPTGSGAANYWFSNSSTLGSKLSRASRASFASVHGDVDVEELEMLLEAYFTHIDGTFNKLITLREYVDDTEDYINIQLDNHRNRLIQLELVISSATVALTFYALVVGIFGMNIPYTWNKDYGNNPYTWNKHYGYVFQWVVIVTGAVCATIFISIMSYAYFKGLVGSWLLGKKD